MTALMEPTGPHAYQRVHHLGAPLAGAVCAVVMLHGRGASAEDILNLAQAMYHPEVAYLAPAAAEHSWYPMSFLAPRDQNEPWLTSALRKVESTVKLALDSGIPLERVVLCGFSQGACLSTEFVARNPARYGGVLAFTGGLIGPEIFAEEYAGDLSGTPVFLGSGDPDPHVPWSRVEQSARVLEALGGMVTLQRYAGRPHTVSGDEVQHGRRMIAALFG